MIPEADWPNVQKHYPDKSGAPNHGVKACAAAEVGDTAVWNGISLELWYNVYKCEMVCIDRTERSLWLAWGLSLPF